MESRGIIQWLELKCISNINTSHYSFKDKCENATITRYELFNPTTSLKTNCFTHYKHGQVTEYGRYYITLTQCCIYFPGLFAQPITNLKLSKILKKGYTGICREYLSYKTKLKHFSEIHNHQRQINTCLKKFLI